jgi:hypothetical protein
MGAFASKTSSSLLVDSLTPLQKKVVRAARAFLRRLPGKAYAFQIGNIRLDGETGAITAHASGTAEVTRWDRQAVHYFVQSDPSERLQFDSVQVYVELSLVMLTDAPEVLRAIGAAMASLFSKTNVANVHVLGTQVLDKAGGNSIQRRGVRRSFRVVNGSNGNGKVTETFEKLRGRTRRM